MTDDIRNGFEAHRDAVDADSSGDVAPEVTTLHELALRADAESDIDTVVVPRDRANLERGYVRARLITELALGEKRQDQLAEEYGVARSTIAMFKKRHLTRIEQKQENLADEYSDLWIAKKRNRLEEYQIAVEKMAANPDARSAEVLAKLLKDVAEELGDLPKNAAVQINQANVTYQIENVNTEDLR